MTPIEVKSVAKELETESKGMSKQIARQVFGEVPYGADKLSKQEFLDMLRRNWSDVNYRMALGGYYDPQGVYHYGRISPEAFLSAAAEAGLIPPNWEDSVNG